MDFNRDGFTDIQDVILLCAAIVGIISAVYALTRQVLKPMGRWIQREFREAVRDTITPDLLAIKREVTANGGGSLKDLVRENHKETLAIFERRDQDFAQIAGPWAKRVEALENGHRTILSRIEGIGSQVDSKTDEILHQLEDPPTEGSP